MVAAEPGHQERQTPPRASRYSSLAFALFLVLAAAAVAGYLTLVARTATLRGGSLHFYLTVLLPIALLHIGILTILFLISRRNRLVPWLFLIVSAAAFVLAGGRDQVWAVCATVAFAAVLVLGGRLVCQDLFHRADCGWETQLGFGILFSSLCGAFLAQLHALNRVILVIIGLLVIAIALARGAQIAIHLRGAEGIWRQNSRLSTILAFEGMFLLACFVVVLASAPESRSDAIRFYWPFVKLLDHDRGFPDIPFLWSYIVPQAGLTYAAADFVLFGDSAARLVMCLCLVSLVLMVARKSGARLGSRGIAVALIAASSPVILWTSTSLMEDTFVSLATFLLGLVALEGKSPGSGRFWIITGALAGVCWTAKFSTLAYAGPLILWAFGRSWRRVGPKKSLAGLGICAVMALLAASPWLWHSYQESRNPVFPFLLRFMPAPLWPDGVPGMAGLFAFPRGWKSLLSWPFEMTFQTGRFVEGLPGFLGVSLLVLLLLALSAVCTGPGKARGYAIAAFAGTAGLWTITAYVRYWLPGMWLLAAAAATGVSQLTVGHLRKGVFLCIAFVILLSHFPMEMAHNWMDPHGWPWDYYSGSLSKSAYLRRWPGYDAFHKLEALSDGKAGWAKVWFTGTEAVGHWNFVPLEASVWEFALHRANDRASMKEYLALPGCEYWIVNTASDAAKWFRAAGLADDFWTAARRVAVDSSLEIYRLKSKDERSGSLERYLARVQRPPNLLANGGFEEGAGENPDAWTFLGHAQWVLDPHSAREGLRYVKVGPGTSVIQGARLSNHQSPRLRLTEWARSSHGAATTPIRLQVNWNDLSHHLLSATIEVVEAQATWKRFEMLVTPPPHAAYAFVYLTNYAGGESDFDSVRLEPIDSSSKGFLDWGGTH